MADFTTQRYDIIRKKMEQQAGAGADEQRDALKRNFARGGMIGSGAQIKNEQLLENKIASAKQNARESVDVQELADRQRQEEILQSQGFAKGEREASQTFGAGQAAIERKWRSGERLSSQDFATRERVGSQDFATRERVGSQNFARLERIAAQKYSKKLFDREMEFKIESRDLQDQRWTEQFNEDKRVTDFNMKMAEKTFNKRTLMEQMLDPGNTGKIIGNNQKTGEGWGIGFGDWNY